MINFNIADPKYMLKLGLVRFGFARFKSLGTLRICLIQIYKTGIFLCKLPRFFKNRLLI